MKRLYIAAGLLLLMLAGCLLNAWYTQQLTDEMIQDLQQAQQAAREENWEQAESLTRQVYEQWNRRHFYLHVVMRHSDTDQILRSFRSVLQYLEIREMDQYAAANADLMTQLELLGEMEQASLVNVL
mgnify:FL=1